MARRSARPALEIKGTADATALFSSWRLEYGLGDQPGNWALLNQSNTPVRDGTLYLWDLSSVSEWDHHAAADGDRDERRGAEIRAAEHQPAGDTHADP